MTSELTSTQDWLHSMSFGYVSIIDSWMDWKPSILTGTGNGCMKRQSKNWFNPFSLHPLSPTLMESFHPLTLIRCNSFPSRRWIFTVRKRERDFVWPREREREMVAVCVSQSVFQFILKRMKWDQEISCNANRMRDENNWRKDGRKARGGKIVEEKKREKRRARNEKRV